MLKIIILISMLTSNFLYASPVEQMMTTKEKLRISLWFEGIESEKPQLKTQNSEDTTELPEEIERALIKM